MDNVFRPLDWQAEIQRRRRNLPHWEQPGCTYFVTFRTADSLPQVKLRQLEEEKKIWLSRHSEPRTQQVREEHYRRFIERVQEWLDAGYGACVLRNSEPCRVVVSTLLRFDGERYILDEFVVMPNHVHVILKPGDTHSLEQILHSWKSFTANRINRRIRSSGAFWMDETFDHAVRSWEQLEHYRRYIRENPLKAALNEGSYILGKGKTGIILPA